MNYIVRIVMKFLKKLFKIQTEEDILEEAIRGLGQKAIDEAIREGRSVTILKDGKIIRIKPSGKVYELGTVEKLERIIESDTFTIE